MTFKLIKNPTFCCPVTITVPTDAGQVDQTLNVRFKVLSDDATSLEVGEFLHQAVLHFDDIVDDDGAAIAFSPEVLAQMIAIPYVRTGLMKGYWRAMSGAKLGN